VEEASVAKDIQLGDSCDQRWADLEPRGPGRYCALCDTTVIDVSRLSRREVRERLRAEGRICGRVRLDEDGEPIFRAEPERRLGVRALAVVGALAGGCTAGGDGPEPRIERAVSEGDDAPPTFAAAGAMQPVPPLPEGVSVEELPGEQLASLEETLASMSGPVEPTEEQRRLTEAKRRRRQRATTQVSQPPPQVFMGMMVEPDF
jgi:hypothetical protein